MDAVNDRSLAVAPGSASFGTQHFGACRFGDQRLTQRAVISADAMLRHPHGTPPEKFDRAELRGFYGMVNNPKVNHANMLEAHVRRTRAAMAACGGRTVLVIHDPTEVDYSGLRSVGDDLGQLGNGHGRGLLLHNVLAVDYDNREVLGLVAQFPHRRRDVPKRESRLKKLNHPQRESRLWCKGVDAIGAAPDGATWVNLCDRGGDTFESLERQQQFGQRFVIRSRSNRRVEVRDALGRRRKAKLHAFARRLATLGERTVHVSATRQHPARAATVRVACGAVRLFAPHPKRGEHSTEPLDLWVVYVGEVDPPDGVEPLEWILLTNVPTETRQQADERVDWYACRPIVEELHKAQKTGCGIEQLQFTTRKALEATMALFSVVAVQLLRLRDLSRRPDAEQRRADEVVGPTLVEVLSLWRFKEARPDLNAKDFLYALARLGGHQGRRGDGPPGWLVLWRGWMELQRLVEGAQLNQLKRSG